MGRVSQFARYRPTLTATAQTEVRTRIVSNRGIVRNEHETGRTGAVTGFDQPGHRLATVSGGMREREIALGCASPRACNTRKNRSRPGPPRPSGLPACRNRTSVANRRRGGGPRADRHHSLPRRRDRRVPFSRTGTPARSARTRTPGPSPGLAPSRSRRRIVVQKRARGRHRQR